ncbi:MAG TPA: carbon-nitrogen hydrolase family protein [Puia sp.]|jgi:predicted amidohydrolase|nr:carbon-nitrogen hydrolase family protein [Puia sp.]
MRIGVAQTRPFKGDILRNIEAHLRLIELAGRAQADTIVFPELSITGYEPELAAGLATTIADVRLDVFQTLSERYSMAIGVGIPTTDGAGVRITELIFQPGQARQAYHKRYLHADEEPWFICGTDAGSLKGEKIALAICYELSVPAHSEEAHRKGAEIYLVSVAKSKAGMERAAKTLADIARRYSMTVLISNCVGHCDNFDCGGRSAVWNREGILLAQLDETEEGVLVLDTETGEVVKQELDQIAYEG